MRLIMSTLVNIISFDTTQKAMHNQNSLACHSIFNGDKFVRVYNYYVCILIIKNLKITLTCKKCHKGVKTPCKPYNDKHDR